jgi:tRNA threonylcarbamoyladenosine biosynthesis protein TsaE
MPVRAIETESDAVTQAVGCALGALVAPGDVIVLSGDLGAGKTQLTKGLATGLGIAEPVTSPTFNILIVHEGRISLNHFDLYRLESPAELEDIDYWGTLESGGVSAVEWGDRFAEAVPEECVVVRIHITGDDARVLSLEPRGLRGEALVAAWAKSCASVPGATVRSGSE